MTVRTGSDSGPRLKSMPSAAAALAELGLTTPANSTKRLLHPQDRPARLLAPGRVTIPRFDTLREMAERYSAQLEHARHHRRSPVISAGHRSELISVVRIGFIYCQIAAMRIFSLRRMSTYP